MEEEEGDYWFSDAGTDEESCDVYERPDLSAASSYQVLDENDVQRKATALVDSVSNLLSVSSSHSIALLR